MSISRTHWARSRSLRTYLNVLRTSGPYPDTVDLSVSPLAPGQGKQFRLTFEHVSNDWNHEYPELQVTDVSVKSLWN